MRIVGEVYEGKGREEVKGEAYEGEKEEDDNAWNIR